MLLKQKENFIIPMIFKNTYEDLCLQLINTDYFIKVEELKETELHAFINRRFWQDENGHCEIYKVNPDKGRDALVSLFDTVQDLDIDISCVRLYVFKSGIMFMVISAEYAKGKDGVLLYEAEETNAALKDLYIHKGRFLLFDKKLKLTNKLDDVVLGNTYTYGEIKTDGLANEEGKQKVILTIGSKQKDKLVIENEVTLYKNKHTNEYIGIENGFFSTVKNKQDMIKCYKCEEISLVYIINRVLSHLDVELDDYFSASKNTDFPKKAVVFNMHVLDNDKVPNAGEELFYLSHGYTHSYKYSKTDEKLISTFDNSYWKISREGAANINIVENISGDHFLHHEFANKFDSIYLWIMILVLHQYYGLQYFTCMLLKIYQECMFIEKTGSKKQYLRLLMKMEEAKNKGDLFLLQYSFVDISQISHQNDIYMQIYEVYNLEKMIEDYSVNAEICSKVLEHKQQKALQKKVAFLARISTFFTLFTAVTQTLMGLVELNGTVSYVLRILLGIAGIGLVVIGLSKNK